MATLVFHLEDEREIVVPVVDSVSLGSAEGNDVMVDDRSISPSHAEITLNSSGGFLLRDLGSSSGTFVNGTRVQAHPLHDGDELVFGTLRGRFVLTEEDKTAVSRRKPADQMEKEYKDALQKHQMLVGVLQGLAGEENKRMANLERLQQAVVSAEKAQASVEARARKAKDELSQSEKREAGVRQSIDKLNAEHAELAELIARHGPKIKTVEREYEDALQKHRMLTGVLQNLAGEENKRMANLERLQQAVVSAENAQTTAEAKARKAEDEASQSGKREMELRESVSKLNAELVELTARLGPLHKTLELEALTADCNKLTEEKTRTQKHLEELAATLETRNRELERADEQCAKALALAKEHEQSLEPLQNEITATQDRFDELKTALAGCEAAVASAKADQQQVLAEQELARQSLDGLIAEKKRATDDLSTIASKRAKLTGAVSELERSVRDMTERQSEGILALRERERSMRDAIKGIEQCKAEQERIRSESQALDFRQTELGTLVQALVAEEAEAEARVAELEVLAKAREDQIATNTRRLHQIEDERKAVQARVDALAGTEQQLLQAREELAESRKEHSAIIAIVAERDARQRELDETRSRLKELASARTTATQELTDARIALEEFNRAAADERQRLAVESQSLEKEAATRRETLTGLTRQLQETSAKHEDLLNRNRQLEGVEEKLRQTRAELVRTQNHQSDLATKTLTLEKEAEQAHTKLQGLQTDVKSVSSALDKHRADEVGLKKAVAKLQAGQADETKRLEEIRRLAVETERKATSQRAELDVALEKRRRDIQAQEDRFHAIQSLREEIDELYAKIDASGESPADALAAWKEAKKKKEELAGLLPNEGGIRVRPQVRTVLVPRAKDA